MISIIGFFAYGQITLKTPVLVGSPKLSSVEPHYYLDGGPLGNTRYCKPHKGGVRGVMVIVVGNGHGDTSSNPGRD